MRNRVLVEPAVADIGSFGPLMSHLGHYLGHTGCERIVIPIDGKILADAGAWLEAPELPPAFDKAVLDRIARVRDAVVLRPWPSNLNPPALTTDLVIDWDVRRSELEPWATIKAKYRQNRTLFEVDWGGIRHGASSFAEAAMVLMQGRSFNAAGALGMEELFRRLGLTEKASLIGTGPSAREAMDHELSEGIRIVCNTVVLDGELMDHIRPHILTFADPIFHFGPSTYAQRFQRAVVEQARKHDFMIVTTERFAPLFRAHVPELADRVIGLRLGTSKWPDNFDMSRHPAVRPYPNVLTMLMLPIASSFARTIELIGFDGRAPDEAYFWRHGSTVQLDQELDDIRLVHPGFFDLDYESYYNVHVAQLEGMARRLEARGTDIHSLTKSHMAPLRRRFSGRASVPRDTATVVGPRLISLTPDWIDDFGHFGPFERRIHHAAENANFNHIALASRGLIPEEEWEIPLFTGFFSSVLRGGGEFEVQLSRGLNQAHMQSGSIVMFYAADVWHLPPILRVACQHPETRFVINLMKSHDWIGSALRETNPWARSLGDLLKASLRTAAGTNVDVTVDTEVLAADVELLVGHSVPVWPMVAVSSPRLASNVPEKFKGPGIHIVCPVHAHLNKGFSDVALMSERLQQRIESGVLRLTVRYAPQPVSIPPTVEVLCNRLLDNGATVVRDNLDDDEFAGLVDSADVVLVPYRIRPFRTRTSGVVLDALIAGKPVVTVRGTWAGDLIERLGAGATYDDGDVADMASSLDQVINHLPAYRERVASLRERIITDFAPERLIEFLHQRTELPANPPNLVEIDDLNERAERLRDLYQEREIQRDTHKFDLAIAHDDRRRVVDDRDDRIGILDESVVWHRGVLAKANKSRVAPELKEQIYMRSDKARLDEIELVALLVDPDGLVSGHMVDVGAHHGSALSHFLGRGWAITAFEPDVRHFEHLESRYGDDERVTLDKRAVTSRSRESRPLYISDESTGVSGLSAFLDSHVVAGMVETVALRDVLDDHHVDVLKIDTEGFDLSVLQGFPWERDSPKVIICEFEDRKTVPLGYTTRDLGDFLVERGYQVWMSEWHPIVRYGIQHDWHQLVPYPCEPSSPEAWGNFLAFKNPRGEGTVASALAASLRVEKPDQTRDPRSLSQTRPQDAAYQQGDYEREGKLVSKPSLQRGRRQAVLRSLRGSLGPVLGTTLLFAILGAGLAIFDQGQLALIAGAAGIASSVLGTLIVATRIERRTR